MFLMSLGRLISNNNNNQLIFPQIIHLINSISFKIGTVLVHTSSYNKLLSLVPLYFIAYVDSITNIMYIEILYI